MVLKTASGYNGTNCGTNYAVGNSNAYIKNDMLPKLLPNKTYHISFLSKGTADTDNFVFRLYGKTWSEIKDETAAVSGALNETLVYTASSEYTVSADDEGTVIKEVMTAKSTGAVSGKKAVSAVTNEAGSLGQRKITVNITGSGSVSYGGTNIENGGSISVVYGSDTKFTLECDDSHMVSSVKFGGDTLSFKKSKVFG